MATWPESSPTPQYPLDVTPVWQTAIVDLGGGGESRRGNWLFPKFDVTVTYDVLSAANAQTLWQFYMARRGAAEAFYIYDLSLLESISFAQTSALYCGTADGSETTFDIPGRSTSSHTIYANGVAVDPGDYALDYGTGTSGSDRVIFDVAPTAGYIVSAKFTGYLRMRVRFAQDRLTRKMFEVNLMRYGAIELMGLKPA